MLRSYRVHGKGNDKYDNVRIGMNSRLDTVQAAILCEKLEVIINYELEKVKEIAEMYSEKLFDIVQTPKVLDGYVSSWAQYSILCKDSYERDAIMKTLKSKGIPSMIYYKKPLHRQTAFQNYKESMPVTLEASEDICSRILSLPMHPYLSQEDIQNICNNIILGTQQ